ncbi:MAG TPA: DUF4105 domain-containing protein, partial [Gemmatimonadales bacterium]|nr:DUF4105 domain-containing protein [Gemmatimonadales bacterium]
TAGPGKHVWEKFGHNSIIVFDRTVGRAASFNYGIFDFQQERFLLRFVQGRMWYAMQGRRAQRDMDLYTRTDRSLWLQELELTGAQKAALRDFLLWNDTDERRNYYYDYYRDNCSTRVRDALDRALGGVLKARFDSVNTRTSYRWHTARLVGPSPVLYTGIMLGLGHPADRDISAWEAMFLPVQLQAHLRDVRVRDDAGVERPLVRAEREVHRSARYPEPAAPRSFVPPFLAIGLVAGGLLWWLGGRAARGARLAFGALGSAWSLLAGVGGLALLGLWLLTDHVITRNNPSVLLLTPLSLALVVLVPRAVRAPSARRGAVRVARAVAALAGLSIVTLAWPGLHQPNPELLALVLPIHVGLLAGLSAIAARDAAG